MCVCLCVRACVRACVCVCVSLSLCPRRGEHVLGEHRHGEHVEGTAQTAQVSVPQCRRPALLSNPATRRAPPEEDGGRFERCLGEGVSQ